MDHYVLPELLCRESATIADSRVRSLVPTASLGKASVNIRSLYDHGICRTSPWAGLGAYKCGSTSLVAGQTP